MHMHSTGQRYAEPPLCAMPCMQWPGVASTVRPPNAGLRLFGGAAFERCLNEFQEAANALTFPTCE